MAMPTTAIRQIDAIYVISYTVERPVSDEAWVVDVNMTGGGICIDRRGLIVSVAHLFPKYGLEGFRTEVLVRSRNMESGFINATIEHLNHKFDIAFLMIDHIPGDDQNGNFGHIDLPDNPIIRESANLFSYLHQKTISFSLFWGKVSYPFNEFDEVIYPSAFSPLDMGDEVAIVDRIQDAFSCTVAYRTTGSVITEIDTELHDLHPNLPIIEAHGFHTSGGASGCAVFTEHGVFVGLFLFILGGRDYILPTHFIRNYIMERFGSNPKLLPTNLLPNLKRKWSPGSPEKKRLKLQPELKPLTKSKPCCHFARQSCMKGDDCPFDHQLSKYPCNNYVSQGSCIRGSNCMFSHEVRTSQRRLFHCLRYLQA